MVLVMVGKLFILAKKKFFILEKGRYKFVHTHTHTLWAFYFGWHYYYFVYWVDYRKYGAQNY